MDFVTDRNHSARFGRTTGVQETDNRRSGVQELLMENKNNENSWSPDLLLKTARYH